MRKSLWLVFWAALAGGCASVGGDPCASDWFTKGENEGMLNANQEERYAARCPAFDSARYQQGFQAGFARRARPMV